MARVYLAEKTTRGLRRLVVLKILEPNFASDPDMRAAFRREAEVCARLNHPNIVQVFEFVYQDGGYYIVMEPVDGIDISWSGPVGDRQRTRQHHGRPFQAVCLWSTEVIEALHEIRTLLAKGAMSDWMPL